MKKCFVLAFMLFTISLAAQSYRFYKADGKQVNLEEIAQQTASSDVIFFGEFHDDVLVHKLEIDFLELMFQINPDLIVSMEMFERDTQPIVDKYLKGDILEEEFINDSRAWPNYNSDYKPIVEFAKAQKLQLLAANIPRYLASTTAKKGFAAVDSLNGFERSYAAEKNIVLYDKYYEKFNEVMKANMAGHGGMPVSEEMIKSLYDAQCLKDDTMAESIANKINEIPESLIIHFNGDFHSRYHLGTAQKLRLIKPDLDIIVISPVYNKDTAFQSDFKQFGDYILVIEKSDSARE